MRTTRPLPKDRGRDIYDEENFDRDGYDLLLTNTDKGFSHVLNFALRKNYDNGFNFSTSYSWQKSHGCQFWQ